MFDSLTTLLLLLTSSVLAVGLFRVLRLPAMLAYFFIGVVLGPHFLDLLQDSESGRQVAEFGIVFLIVGVISYRDMKSRKITQCLDILLFTLVGFIGMLLLLLWVATDH